MLHRAGFEVALRQFRLFPYAEPARLRFVFTTQRTHHMAKVQQSLRKPSVLLERVTIVFRCVFHSIAVLAQKAGVVEDFSSRAAYFDQLTMQIERLIEALTLDGKGRESALGVGRIRRNHQRLGKCQLGLGEASRAHGDARVQIRLHVPTLACLPETYR